MNVTRRVYLHGSTALRASLAAFFAYDIPSDQPAAREVPAHIAARMKGLGVNVGSLAVTHAVGRA